ncbi:hypothetical protein SmJEL517_g04970 [Synchytrium microbalum]|uniref:GDP-mannose transporter n=1 Tax=Synchytrium microbalum TaxID=1806994 RepID=A0A507BWD3_9FUNG|nr:uncharacterized protein SmJEL517_g04970 [Synchytrium microbalum]TPX31772.1 hypothetical protein SmJEL517_g04970 [Synchytrium microbalum]
MSGYASQGYSSGPKRDPATGLPIYVLPRKSSLNWSGEEADSQRYGAQSRRATLSAADEARNRARKAAGLPESRGATSPKEATIVGTILSTLGVDDESKPEAWLERVAQEKKKEERRRKEENEWRSNERSNDRSSDRWSERNVPSTSSTVPRYNNTPRVNTGYVPSNEGSDPDSRHHTPSSQSPTSSSPHSPMSHPPPPPPPQTMPMLQSIQGPPSYGNSKNAKYTKAEEARNRARKAAGLPELPPSGAPPPSNPILSSLANLGIPVPKLDKKPERWLEKIDKQRKREEAIAIISGTEDKYKEEQQRKVPEYIRMRNSQMGYPTAGNFRERPMNWDDYDTQSQHGSSSTRAEYGYSMDRSSERTFNDEPRDSRYNRDHNNSRDSRYNDDSRNSNRNSSYNDNFGNSRYNDEARSSRYNDDSKNIYNEESKNTYNDDRQNTYDEESKVSRSRYEERNNGDRESRYNDSERYNGQSRNSDRYDNDYRNSDSRRNEDRYSNNDNEPRYSRNSDRRNEPSTSSTRNEDRYNSENEPRYNTEARRYNDRKPDIRQDDEPAYDREYYGTRQYDHRRYDDSDSKPVSPSHEYERERDSRRRDSHSSPPPTPKSQYVEKEKRETQQMKDELVEKRNSQPQQRKDEYVEKRNSQPQRTEEFVEKRNSLPKQPRDEYVEKRNSQPRQPKEEYVEKRNSQRQQSTEEYVEKGNSQAQPKAEHETKRDYRISTTPENRRESRDSANNNHGNKNDIKLDARPESIRSASQRDSYPNNSNNDIKRESIKSASKRESYPTPMASPKQVTPEPEHYKDEDLYDEHEVEEEHSVAKPSESTPVQNAEDNERPRSVSSVESFYSLAAESNGSEPTEVVEQHVVSEPSRNYDAQDFIRESQYSTHSKEYQLDHRRRDSYEDREPDQDRNYGATRAVSPSSSVRAEQSQYGSNATKVWFVKPQELPYLVGEATIGENLLGKGPKPKILVDENGVKWPGVIEPPLGVNGPGPKSRDIVMSGGATAIIAYCIASILLTVTNKLVLSGYSFRMNFLLLACQSFACVLFLQIFSSLNWLSYRKFKLHDAKRWFPVSLGLVAMIWTGSKAMQYLSIPVFTIFKNLTIVMIAYGELWFFGGSPVSPLMLISFTLMVLSSAVAGWADISAGNIFKVGAAEVSPAVSYGWMFLNCGTTAYYTLYIRGQIKEIGFKDYDTVYYNNLLSGIVLSALSVLTEIPEGVRTWNKYLGPSATEDDSSAFNGLVMGIIFSSVLSFGISYTTSWCLRVTSSTTYSMAGALNKLPIAVAGMMFFSDPVTLGSVTGVVIGSVRRIVTNSKASVPVSIPAVFPSSNRGDKAVKSDTSTNQNQDGNYDKEGQPTIVDGTYSENARFRKSKPLEDREYSTSDINVGILNQLYGHLVKVVSFANAFRSSNFEKVAVKPGEIDMPKENANETPTTGATLDNLRRFLVQHAQRERPTARLNPTTSVVPLVNRTFLSHDTGPGTHSQRVKRSGVVRAAHAKEDAQLYKQPLSVLWESFMGSGGGNSMSGFNSLVEERIQAARREGLFDNLKGRGQPLKEEDERLGNPYLDATTFFLNRMVKNQGHLPPWIEMGKDIDSNILKSRHELLTMRREWLSKHSPFQPPKASPFQTVNNPVVWPFIKGQSSTPPVTHTSQALKEWETRALSWATVRCQETNGMIRKFNIEAPRGIPQRFMLNPANEVKRAEKAAEAAVKKEYDEKVAESEIRERTMVVGGAQ